MPTSLSYARQIPYVAQYYYPPEYFSGCDVRVYANGIWIDEINQISFMLQEKRAPIYGYASVVFDAVAQGTKIVQGWFDINFKEAGYLTKLLHEMTAEGELQKPYSVSLNTTLMDKMSDSEFDRWAESWETAIWADKETLSKNAQALAISNWMLAEDRTFDVGGFDILITYGAYEARVKSEYAKRYSEFGTGTPMTVNSINQVYLVGLSKVIDSSGNPVMERYNFIARDINKPIARR